jgi:hypothetical protein
MHALFRVSPGFLRYCAPYFLFLYALHTIFLKYNIFRSDYRLDHFNLKPFLCNKNVELRRETAERLALIAHSYRDRVEGAPRNPLAW